MTHTLEAKVTKKTRKGIQIGSIVSGNFSSEIAVLLGVSAIVMGILAYVVTPEDKSERSK